MGGPDVKTVSTKPYEGQKPGTSGLRKKTKTFMQENFVENFVQSTFDALDGDADTTGELLVLGGDGRYFNKDMTQTIIRMAYANGVAKVLVGQHGLISTPAVSHLVRSKGAAGAFILTASHNPAGPNEDCGIKYNSRNGGPAPESVTSAIYERTKTISEYRIADLPEVDLAEIGETKFGDSFSVEVIDATETYAQLMDEVFDLGEIKDFLSRDDFVFTYDAMHGVAGPFAKRIFHEELGVPLEQLLNCEPLEDFGGGHPDPNLTYAHDLVECMGLDQKGMPLKGVDPESLPDFGAAADGDADRNMILGKQFFVTPSDSLAVIANNAECIKYFKDGLKTVARSMPTSGAADRVAEEKDMKFFETPTGWKYFGNLMDAKELTGGKKDYNPVLCGEESFGTGSSHIREKDGIFAVLCWLNILAAKNEPSAPLVTVEDVVREHWDTFGRNYYTRYDYENVDADLAQKVMSRLNGIIFMFEVSNRAPVDIGAGFTLANCDEFEFHDEVDGSVSPHQGWRFLMEDGSRFVFRLSGTGSVGATIRLYIERYSKDDTSQETASALESLVQLALDFSDLHAITGREGPTVIT
ncbi:Phosphoglucomutase [Hondaea fermentalgiana]|uniref:phosphoglucomutase (alpha-D-glucose-1,6-bisphosphate-dependent) n=1 Tax=Hondaea fermentalgiana TaxID=2315210 RepID=A0A2R5FZ22_9STRA|nr:Phosphoglucomutase [Hondaea fermentalgiana]|eukprot:GBG24002.1 Phosphoglucomutase [Hondaea fermentalgiana]